MARTTADIESCANQTSAGTATNRIQADLNEQSTESHLVVYLS